MNILKFGLVACFKTSLMISYIEFFGREPGEVSIVNGLRVRANLLKVTDAVNFRNMIIVITHS